MNANATMPTPGSSATLADLTVISVTFNSAHCIEPLAASLGMLPSVIFVDNASIDDTVATIRTRLPGAKVLVNARNEGFGRANNRALRDTTTRWALLLNPDCLPTPEFFAQLMAAATRHPDAAIIAPHLIRRNDQVEVSYRWPDTEWISRGPGAEGDCCVGFACGAALLLNMDRLRKLGFFDEEFFLYYEDEDLCQRVFKSGQQIILVPTISVQHLSRGSVKGSSPLRFEYLRGYHHAQSKVMFARKHFGLVQARALHRKTLMLALLSLPFRVILPPPRYAARLIGRIAGLMRMRVERPA